jgi:hypothetical protein
MKLVKSAYLYCIFANKIANMASRKQFKNGKRNNFMQVFAVIFRDVHAVG